MPNLRTEFDIADKSVNRILKHYKYDSDDWNGVGMLERQDAILAAREICKVFRKTLKIITLDYNVRKSFEKPVKDYADKIKNLIMDELYSVDIFVHESDDYVDRYGNIHNSTEKTELRNFQYEIAKETDVIDLQLLRFRNYRKRKNLEFLVRWLPIAISTIALIVSFVSLFK